MLTQARRQKTKLVTFLGQVVAHMQWMRVYIEHEVGYLYTYARDMKEQHCRYVYACYYVVRLLHMCTDTDPKLVTFLGQLLLRILCRGCNYTSLQEYPRHGKTLVAHMQSLRLILVYI